VKKKNNKKIIIKDDLGSNFSINKDGTIEVHSEHKEIKSETNSSKLSDYSKSKLSVRYYDEDGIQITNPKKLAMLQKKIRKIEKKSNSVNK
tara:strand:+ start:67 stop:339 length:273 start_codon:yes stop_codon:yes gene_type:complete